MDYLLLTFVTVAEKKNFTRAAEMLHVTQSAVTLSIKSLEKQYNVTLFDRTNKYVRLTKAGELLYHYAKEILYKYDLVNSLIVDLTHSSSGPISIGSSYTFGEYLLPKLVSKFNSKYPLIQPSISIRNSKRIITQLLDGEIDLAIIEGSFEHSELVIQPFFQDEMVVILSTKHPLSSKNEVELRELYGETWIIREEGSGSRQTIEQLFSENDFSPNNFRSFGSSQIIKEAVETGLGISILSKHVIRKEIQLKTLHSLGIKNNPLFSNFSFAVPRSNFQSNSTKLFLDFLQENSVLELLSESFS